MRALGDHEVVAQARDDRQPQPEAGIAGGRAIAASLIADEDPQLMAHHRGQDLDRPRPAEVRVLDAVGHGLGHRQADGIDVVSGKSGAAAGELAQCLPSPRDRPRHRRVHLREAGAQRDDAGIVRPGAAEVNDRPAAGRTGAPGPAQSGPRRGRRPVVRWAREWM